MIGDWTGGGGGGGGGGGVACTLLPSVRTRVAKGYVIAVESNEGDLNCKSR